MRGQLDHARSGGSWSRRRHFASIGFAFAVTVMGGSFVTPLSTPSARAEAKKSSWKLDTTDYPKEMLQAYDAYVKKCGKCHSLSRAAPGLSKDSKWWKGYLRKMMRMSGSGINKPTAKKILDFAKFYRKKLNKDRNGDADL